MSKVLPSLKYGLSGFKNRSLSLFWSDTSWVRRGTPVSYYSNNIIYDVIYNTKIKNTDCNNIDIYPVLV